MSASDTLPVFAVVGRVNKGKSSIVATLVEDPDIPIDARPRTTRDCLRYAVEVGGARLFEIVDTPGFEEADRALAWLRDQAGSAADRAETVRRLVEVHEAKGELLPECRLLRPIIDGASILYVVDGTRPYRPNFEAEMEILRWTGRPGMALINRIGEEDHSEAWRRALDQYFKVVREFDAHGASFSERLALLQDFSVLRPDWRSGLERAVSGLGQQRVDRREEAAAVIAEMLARCLSFTLTRQVPKGRDPQYERGTIEADFHAALRAYESDARREVERLYRHRGHFSEEDLSRPAFGEDLFAKSTWDDFGLSGWQLLTLGAVAGATTGGLLDASVGGLSGGGGILAGGLIGAGAGAWRASRRLAAVHDLEGARRFASSVFGKSPPKLWRIGPHENPDFPFVLLDRAVQHFEAVARRAHGRRGDEALAPRSRDLEAGRRKRIASLARTLRSAGDDPAVVTLRELAAVVAEQLRAADQDTSPAS